MLTRRRRVSGHEWRYVRCVLLNRIRVGAITAAAAAAVTSKAVVGDGGGGGGGGGDSVNGLVQVSRGWW